MALKPLTHEDPLYQLLRDGDVKKFNLRKAQRACCDLTHSDFRNLDLRGLDASGVDFSNSYFRGADLRGVNFTTACLIGASIMGAKISGTYFPSELPAEEIRLSVKYGTRMRYHKQ